jgi:ADP-ribose pyrophosphatase
MFDDVPLPTCHSAHLTEVPLSQATVWRGNFLDVRCDRVRLPDGREATREYIHHPGAVMVVALLDEDRLVVERQYRYPLAQAMLELPAGKLDPAESSFACAERELREETGYRALEWAFAGRLHPAIGYADETIDIWFARGLQPGERALDEGVFLDVLALRGEQLLDAVRDGTVTDGKTLAGLLWWQNVRAGVWQLQWREAGVWRAQAAAGEVPR